MNDKSGALISTCKRYRYRLWRRWNYELPSMVFIMLNPSTADDVDNDATIRRCLGFAKAHECGGIEVVNLFAFRATKPRELWKATDPVGPENDSHILAAANTALYGDGYVVCAWGSNAKSHPRVQVVSDLLFFNAYHTMHALAINMDGTPSHPLILPKNSKLVEFEL